MTQAAFFFKDFHPQRCGQVCFCRCQDLHQQAKTKVSAVLAGGWGTLRSVFNTLIKAGIFGGPRRGQREVRSDQCHDHGALICWRRPADIAALFLQAGHCGAADGFHVVFLRQQPVCRMTDKRVRLRNKIEAVFPGFKNFNERRAVSKGFEMPKAARVREQSTIMQKSRFLVPEIPQNTPLHSVLGALQGRQINGVSRLCTAGCHTQHDTTIKGCDGGYWGLQNSRNEKSALTDMGRQGLTAWRVRGAAPAADSDRDQHNATGR